MLWSVALILMVQIFCAMVQGIEVDGGVSEEIVVLNEVDTAEDVQDIEEETYRTCKSLQRCLRKIYTLAVII